MLNRAKLPDPSRPKSARSRTRSQEWPGNLQGLQTLAQLGVLNVQQMQALRQLVLMSTSLHANDIQGRTDQLISQQAAWRNFLNTQVTIPTSGGQRF